MIGGLGALLFLLSGGVFVKLLQHLYKPSRQEERIALRSSLFFGWALLSSSLLVGSWPPLDAILTPTLFFWPASIILPRLTNRPGLYCGVALLWWLGLFGVSWVLAAWSLGWSLFALSSFVCTGLAYWLSWAMTARRWPLLRVILHTLSFFSTLLLLLPLGLFRVFEQQLPVFSFSLIRGIFALAICIFVLFLGGWATREMIKAGGTPDPFDPPEKLVDTGPYRYLRHPLQIAEVLSVWLLVLLAWHWWLVLYAAAFSFLLLGPMRLIEEDGLAQRFGDKAENYRKEVPGFGSLKKMI